MPRELKGSSPIVHVTKAAVEAIPERPVLVIVYAGEPRDVAAIVDLRRTEIPRARTALLALASATPAEAPISFLYADTVRGMDRELLRLRRSQGRGEPARQREILRLLGRPERSDTRRDRDSATFRDPSALGGIEFEAHVGGATGGGPGGGDPGSNGSG